MSRAEPNTLVVGKDVYWRNAKGGLDPVEIVLTKDRLRDAFVRDLFAEAEALAAQISAFKAKVFTEIEAFSVLLHEQYGAPTGGVKGNVSYLTYDGLIRVSIRVADQVTISGEELQVAKALVTECVKDWCEGAQAPLRKLALDSFDADKEGKLNISKLLALRRIELNEPRWTSAMEALSDAIGTSGSKRYVAIHYRDDFQAPWKPLPLNASAD